MTVDRAAADAWEGNRWVWYWILPASLILPTIAALNSNIATSHKIAGFIIAAAMASLHLTVGRKIVDSQIKRDGAFYFLILCVGASALFAMHPSYFFMLFGLYPILFIAVEGVGLTITFAGLIGIVISVGFAGWDGWTARAWLQGTLQAAVSTIFSVALGLWITRIIDQSKHRNAIIHELELTRSALADAHHAAGIAAERERISLEIHDTLAQGFTSLIMLSQAIGRNLDNEDLAGRSDVSAARRLLQSAEHTARENLAEARSLVAALQPTALQASSLADALERLGARFEEETGIRTTVAVTGRTRELPGNDDVVILRTAQEALANVRKHAAATVVAVSLAFGDDAAPRAHLTIRDDGCGFDPGDIETQAPDLTHGYGLGGIRRRVAEVGGIASVHSSPASGTRIEVLLP